MDKSMEIPLIALSFLTTQLVLLLGNTNISKSAEHKPTGNIHKEISQTYYDRQMKIESMPVMIEQEKQIKPNPQSLSDLRQEINIRESRKDEFVKKCWENKYRTNFQNDFLVANNTVYRPTHDCDGSPEKWNPGEISKIPAPRIEGFYQIAPLDQIFKEDGGWGGPTCSVYHQWSIKKMYPNSPLKVLQHIKKSVNCNFYGGGQPQTTNAEVQSEHFSIKWFCFDKYGTRECLEEIDQ